VQDVGRIRLADVDYPEINRLNGTEAKAYAEKWMLHNMTYLDIDDKSRVDSKDYNRLVCVVYLANPDGTLNTSRNFNKMLIESGHGCIQEYPTNEFNHSEWWNGTIPGSVCIEQPGGAAMTPDVEKQLGLLPPEGKSYVGSLKSDKFHKPGCRWAKKISTKNEIYFESAEDAESKGYEPCGVCHPSRED